MRAINQRIIDRLKTLKLEGQPIRAILTDKGLAALIGISRQTVATWREKGIIPHTVKHGCIHYRIKDVVEAMEAHNSKSDYEKAMEVVEKHQAFIELENRVRELIKRIEALENYKQQ